jgi:hypothetical protein
MENDKGGLYFGTGLDNSQLQKDAAEASRILHDVGEETEVQSANIRELLTNLPEINIDVVSNAGTTLESIDAAFAEIDRVVETNKAAIRELEEEYKRLGVEAGKAYQKGDDKQYVALERQRSVIQKVISERKKMNAEASKTADELLAEEKRLKENAAAAEAAAQKQVSLRQRLREVKIELVEMEAAGQRGTAEYRALQAEAAKLTDAWGDAQAQASILANDQRGMQGIISGLTGVTGAFTAAQGAVGLFAGENEHLQQIMLKVQSLMAITMGLQQVQQTINKDSAFSLVTLNGLKEWWNKLTGQSATKQAAETAATEVNTASQIANATATSVDTAAQTGNNTATTGGTAAQTANTAATTAQTAATTTGTIATKAMSVAMKGLRAALISTGIGALVVLLGYLVNWLLKAFEATSKADEELKEHQEMMKEARKTYAQASMEIQGYTARLESFNGTKAQEKKLVEELNSKYGSALGYYNSAAKWKDILKTKGEAYCQMLLMEAKAQAIMNKYTEAYINVLEVKEKAEKGEFDHWYQTKTGDKRSRKKAISEAQEEANKWEAEYKDLQNQINEFKKNNSLDFHIDPKVGKDNSFDPKKASVEQKLAIAQYKAAIIKYVKDANEEITDLIISSQKQGLTRELNEIRRNTQRKLEAWNEQLNALAEVRKKTAKELYMSKKGATEYDWNNSDDGKKTLKDWISVLYAENPKIQEEFKRVWEQIVVNGEEAIRKSRQEYNDALIDEFGTVEQREEKLLREWMTKLAFIPEEFKEKAMDAMEEAFSKLGSDKFKKAIDWGSVFGDMDKQSISVLQYTLDKVKAYFEQNKSSMSVTEIKDYQEAITKMENEIANRNPFTSLNKSMKNLASAKTEYVDALASWKTAQQDLNDAQAEFNDALRAKNEILEAIDNGELPQDCEELTEAENKLTAARNNASKANEKNTAAEQRTMRARNGITAAYISFSNALRNVGKVVQDVGGKAKNLAAVFDDSVADAIGKAIDFTEDVLDATSSVISAIGDVGKDVASGVEATVSATAQGTEAAAAAGATAISTVEKASVILAVISAALQVATAIANLFNNDEQKQKEIEKLQDRIDQLQWELDNADVVRYQERSISAMQRLRNVYQETYQEVLKLHLTTQQYNNSFIRSISSMIYKNEIFRKSVEKLATAYGNMSYTADKALGGQKYDESRKQLENIAQQQLLIQQQIDKENSKKKTDNGQIQEWENKIAELGEQALTIINDMVEDIIGGSSNDIAKELSDAFFEAFEAGEDAAEAWGAKVNDIVADVLKRMLVQKFLEEPLGQIFDKYKSKWFKDGQFMGIDAVVDSMSGFAADLNAVGEDFAEIWEQLPDSVKNMIQTTSDATREASQQGIATASQESVDELNGRTTAIQGHTYSISENTKLLLATANLILESVLNIELNTDRLSDSMEKVESHVKQVRDTVDDIALKGLKFK